VAPRELELRINPVLDAPVVRPGDTLIARFSGLLTMEQADQIKAGLEAHLPGVEVVVVAADQLVIYRPEPGADA